MKKLARSETGKRITYYAVACSKCGFVVDSVLGEALEEAGEIFPVEDRNGSDGKILAPTIFACSDYQVIGV